MEINEDEIVWKYLWELYNKNRTCALNKFINDLGIYPDKELQKSVSYQIAPYAESVRASFTAFKPTQKTFEFTRKYPTLESYLNRVINESSEKAQSIINISGDVINASNSNVANKSSQSSFDNSSNKSDVKYISTPNANIKRKISIKRILFDAVMIVAAIATIFGVLYALGLFTPKP